MNKLLSHITTERDGESFCPVRIIVISACVVYLLLSIGVFFTSHTFDMQNFGTGLALVLGAGGAVISGKAMTEKPDSAV